MIERLGTFKPPCLNAHSSNKVPLLLPHNLIQLFCNLPDLSHVATLPSIARHDGFTC